MLKRIEDAADFAEIRRDLFLFFCDPLSVLYVVLAERLFYCLRTVPISIYISSQ